MQRTAGVSELQRPANLLGKRGSEPGGIVLAASAGHRCPIFAPQPALQLFSAKLTKPNTKPAAIPNVFSTDIAAFKLPIIRSKRYQAQSRRSKEVQNPCGAYSAGLGAQTTLVGSSLLLTTVCTSRAARLGETWY